MGFCNKEFFITHTHGKIEKSYSCIDLSGNRTLDPRIFTTMLCRLSYQGNLIIQSVQIAIINLITSISSTPMM